MVRVRQITRGISIYVDTKFRGSILKGYRTLFAFAYTITVENNSNDSVQVISRHWEIFDTLCLRKVINEKVISRGKSVLKPGEYESYSSGCLLSSPIGVVHGYLRMVSLSTAKKFRVHVPCFNLFAPFVLN